LNIDLPKTFFEYAENNLNVAKFLRDNKYYSASIYQSEQSFEKIIKSYYILVETKIGHTSEHKVYQKITEFNHEVESGSLELLTRIGNIERKVILQNQNRPDMVFNPHFIKISEIAVDTISGYISRLQKLETEELNKNIETNIKDYENFVSKYFKHYRKGKSAVNKLKDQISKLSCNFNSFLNSAVNLYPCLYKMNETARYPLGDFNYINLDYINRKTACKEIIFTLEDFKTTYKWILNNRHL
jgi:HEPN domain-containing protein